MNPLRQARPSRAQARRGPVSAPAPLAEVSEQPDAATFLARTAAQQDGLIACHRLGDERVWLKRAGPRHGALRYRALAVVAWLLRLDLLRPVPNPGGKAAIAIEARRLAELAALGLRVPQVLAQQDDALLLSDLGQSRCQTHSLHEHLEQAAAESPAALITAWREGLAAIAAVHLCGSYLSQAFARNLVLCPDGVLGYIDFEDDPGQALSLAECQARDWLSYLHATAPLVDAAAPHHAGAHWHAALTIAGDAVHQRLALSARRMAWLARLPASRRLGRDTQRVRAVARLLARWYGQAPAPRR